MNKIIRILSVVLVFLGVWQLIVFLFKLPNFLLPSPLEVLLAFFQHLNLIATHALPTLIETLVGLIGGVVFGCMAGFLVAYYQRLNRWFLPLLIISQAIPTFTIAPLLVIWLGYGMTSKIVTTIMMIFFPVSCALYDGLKETNQNLLDLVKTMNAKKWRVFYHIRLPSALPTLASGIRIAAVVAPVGAIVGEWVGASQGLGYLMLNANARLQIDMMFAVLIVIILLDLVLYFCIDKLLCSLIWWKSL